MRHCSAGLMAAQAHAPLYPHLAPRAWALIPPNHLWWRCLSADIAGHGAAQPLHPSALMWSLDGRGMTNEEPTMLQRPCLSCPSLATAGQSRCAPCERRRQATKHLRRASTPGTNAARRLRAAINKRGHWACALCGSWRAASELEVDHRVAIADGGRDDEANVRTLCHKCHVAKTTAENRKRR